MATNSVSIFSEESKATAELQSTREIYLFARQMMITKKTSSKFPSNKFLKRNRHPRVPTCLQMPWHFRDLPQMRRVFGRYAASRRPFVRVFIYIDIIVAKELAVERPWQRRSFAAESLLADGGRPQGFPASIYTEESKALMGLRSCSRGHGSLGSVPIHHGQGVCQRQKGGANMRSQRRS